MTTQDDFVRRIEAFLASSGMNRTQFGLRACGDPSLVNDLRSGRSPRLVTVAKIEAFMTEHGHSKRRGRQPNRAA